MSDGLRLGEVELMWPMRMWEDLLSMMTGLRKRERVWFGNGIFVGVGQEKRERVYFGVGFGPQGLKGGHWKQMGLGGKFRSPWVGPGREIG